MKKITAILLVVALVAVAIAGSTMAYFSDEAGAVNVATVGNVKIAQHEYQRADGVAHNAGEAGKGNGIKKGDLIPYIQGRPLFPAVPANNLPTDYTAEATDLFFWGDYVYSGTAGNGLWNDDKLANVHDKMVFVENTGKSDLYFRTIIAFECPEGMEYSEGADKEFMMNTNGGSLYDWETIGYTVIDGVRYLLEVATYLNPLEPGNTAHPSLLQVVMTHNANNEDAALLGDTYEILVFSQAVQTEGFANAETALNAAFYEVTTTEHPWADGVKIPVTVSSADDMYAALDAGEKDLVVVGATIDENNFNGHYYEDRNIDFVDCTFTANMNYMYINDATFTNCTFDCGSDNAAVHYDELFGDLVFNNCTFKSGKIQIGANADVTGTVTFNDCVFEQTASTSIWSEAGIRVYSPATFNGCEFNNRVVLAGANGLSITFDSCTMNGGTPVYYVDNTDGIIRGGNIPNVILH